MVNDGSNDETGDVMDLFRKESPRQGTKQLVKESVNGGAKGDVIILVDSNCVLDDKAIEKLVSIFDNPEVGGITGLARSYNSKESVLTKCRIQGMTLPSLHPPL